MKVAVVEGHVSNYPNPIIFSRGTKLTLGKEDQEYRGWIKVTTEDGNSGWAPLEFLDIQSGSSIGIALCDYNAQELNTSPGDVLQIISEYNGWYQAQTSHGLVGWVPVRTVTPL